MIDFTAINPNDKSNARKIVLLMDNRDEGEEAIRA
jgi:hypothetical protein